MKKTQSLCPDSAHDGDIFEGELMFSKVVGKYYI